MIRLSAAGVIATLAEWGAFEILTLSTSYISTEHLAAQTILVSASGVCSHLYPLIAFQQSIVYKRIFFHFAD